MYLPPIRGRLSAILQRWARPAIAMYPLTTTTARIDACSPCDQGRDRAAKLLGITEPSDDPISYAHLLDTLGLDDALWCCRAEPDLSPIWRRYAVWCARQVQGLMPDQRSLDALDVAERHANGQATDQELVAARAAAQVATRAAAQVAARAAFAAAQAARGAAEEAAWHTFDAAQAARDAAGEVAWEAAWEAAQAVPDTAGEARRQQQAAAFRQLVTTGTLP